MTTKHSPGPWAAKGRLVINSKSIVASCPKTVDGIDCYTSLGEKIANARLIASAPELLDLAKDALTQLEKMDFTLSANWNGSIKTNVALLLSEAIAKAEGRE